PDRVPRRARERRAGEPRRRHLRRALRVRRRLPRRREVIGLFLHPRRHPPARERRPPVFERLTKARVGWVVERLAAPFARWEHARLESPEIALPVRDLDPRLVGYRIALAPHLHPRHDVPARSL